jgi:hypothetical protein
MVQCRDKIIGISSYKAFETAVCKLWFLKRKARNSDSNYPWSYMHRAWFVTPISARHLASTFGFLSLPKLIAPKVKDILSQQLLFIYHIFRLQTNYSSHHPWMQINLDLAGLSISRTSYVGLLSFQFKTFWYQFQFPCRELGHVNKLQSM